MLRYKYYIVFELFQFNAYTYNLSLFYQINTGEWTLDKKYTKCDDNGWSYAISFGKLLYNYKHNCSYNKPTNTHARRRRWVRTARMKPERAMREADIHRDSIKMPPGMRPSGAHLLCICLILRIIPHDQIVVMH